MWWIEGPPTWKTREHMIQQQQLLASAKFLLGAFSRAPDKLFKVMDHA